MRGLRAAGGGGLYLLPGEGAGAFVPESPETGTTRAPRTPTSRGAEDTPEGIDDPREYPWSWRERGSDAFPPLVASPVTTRSRDEPDAVVAPAVRKPWRAEEQVAAVTRRERPQVNVRDGGFGKLSPKPRSWPLSARSGQ
jgi:hypothetical protein